MRQKNLKMQIALKFPFDNPDENGIIYSKHAVERAVSSLSDKLPILYRDNGEYQEGEIIGHTAGDTMSVLWDEEYKVCEVILNATLYYGGTECIVNTINDNVVEDFKITGIGISK